MVSPLLSLLSEPSLCFISIFSVQFYGSTPSSFPLVETLIPYMRIWSFKNCCCPPASSPSLIFSLGIKISSSAVISTPNRKTFISLSSGFYRFYWKVSRKSYYCSFSANFFFFSGRFDDFPLHLLFSTVVLCCVALYLSYLKSGVLLESRI